MSFMSWANFSVQLLMAVGEIMWTVCDWLAVLSLLGSKFYDFVEN
jgi:hypothetical protein